MTVFWPIELPYAQPLASVHNGLAHGGAARAYRGGGLGAPLLDVALEAPVHLRGHLARAQVVERQEGAAKYQQRTDPARHRDPAAAALDAVRHRIADLGD